MRMEAGSSTAESADSRGSNLRVGHTVTEYTAHYTRQGSGVRGQELTFGGSYASPAEGKGPHSDARH